MKVNKKFSILSLITALSLFLTGCVRHDANGNPYGMVYKYLAKPGQQLMEVIANFTGNYGWSLIVITIAVRLILLPLMVNQMKKSTLQQEKMNLIKPQMQKIQEMQKKAKTQQQQMMLSQKTMEIYRENGISMTGGIGCLPLIIQMPVFAALYSAIRYSPELSHTVFMGIKLGQKSIPLAVAALLIYLVQSYVSLLGVPEEQKKQMKYMMLLSPIMIFFVSLQSPAGLGIYFFIGGIFAVIQTLIINLYRPKMREKILEDAKQNPPKVVLTDDLIELFENDDKENKESQQTQHNNNSNSSNNNENHKRNAGKQNRKP
ncbi:membrane protein insertase YidC [Lactobacillus sp. S2-2]|uniref:membrane protein insertase YidC n=1 Tax=Lactobacillus sp. S2-2 TaxID=2692917 RepID=UPI001F017192|nr:membrane protein insertase YidC [Lactobacillus sp. S2-2]MCF6515136.1 membrane protein insertase YidC [Lactobacillus sp. S2-2]